MSEGPAGLDGAVAIVTGAAGGLGRAVVAQLHGAGARIVAEDIAAAVTELERPDGTIVALVGDVALAETAQRAVALAQERFGRLDVLINNAGRVLFRSITETTDEDWDGLIASNARGAFVHSRAALPVLERGGAGAIVNIASISGLVGLRDQVAYCMTKGAIVQLTRALAVDYAARGVRVNAVAPGAVSTPLLLNPLREMGDLDEMLEMVAGHHPMARISSPDEIAEVVCFLASPRASFMTGAIVSADGGYTAA
jgi:NAD(P)-dependent dehydrogenase (short-subunit alcohol dehydrogenase family)